MVNIFIIHSGKDYDYVKTFVEPYLMGLIDEEGQTADREGNANILTLESGSGTHTNWKKDAKKQIKLAQVVLFILGEDAGNPGKEQTMGWEISQALKYNKQIMIINRGDYPIPAYLYAPDRFTLQNQPIAKEQTVSQVKERIDDFAHGYYNIFSNEYDNMETKDRLARKSELLDQYKILKNI